MAQVENLLHGDYVTISLAYPTLGTLVEQLSSHTPVSLQDERRDVDLYTIEAEDMEPHMAEARESLRAGIIERFFTNIRENDYIKIGIATLLDIR